MKPTQSAVELPQGLTGHGWLCGLRFDEDSDYPDIYTILLQDRKYGWPIISGGRPLFFTRLELARTALEMDDDPAMRSAMLPEVTIEETYIYDIPEILGKIARDDSDQSSLILDFLNVLLDLVSATQLPLPVPYRRSLFQFANHLTINRDYGAFFAEAGISRGAVRNGIFWSFGAIVSRCRILR